MAEADQVEEFDNEGDEDSALQSAYDQLKPWERLFVDALVEGKRGTEAARAASYGRMRPDTAAWRLQQRPLIRQAIEERKAQIAADSGIDAHRVLLEIGKMAFANMQDFITVHPDGRTTIDLTMLTRDQAAAIQEITVDEFFEGTGDDVRKVTRTKFKLADKRGPLELLGKYFKIWTERQEVVGAGGRAIFPSRAPIIMIGGPPEEGEPAHGGDGSPTA